MPILLDLPDPLEPSPQAPVHPGAGNVEDAKQRAKEALLDAATAVAKGVIFIAWLGVFAGWW